MCDVVSALPEDWSMSSELAPRGNGWMGDQQTTATVNYTHEVVVDAAINALLPYKTLHNNKHDYSNEIKLQREGMKTM